ncbi:Inner-membrane translocator [Frankia canadensis]|uniref:Inner-membrane translocator n=1 Tax=Frankia canadensis TaxID=1836972 RepID=A0A2I2KIN1_9ACTN|nr:ABC transporter permease [Frankia canadensis]SNQ45499.1 Inner-membrane translocator [Frankia canadensis]SOU52789.1 Inner-membrane translocator [Frankia canadensis]
MHYLLTDTLIAGLPLLPVVMGIYLVIRIRQDFDLTVDGSLTLGGAVAAVSLNHGLPVPVAIIAAIAAGMLAGLVTTTLHLAFRVPVILAGLVMSIGMRTLNLRVLGRPSTSLDAGAGLFGGLSGLAPTAHDWIVIAILAAFALVFLAGVSLLLLTEVGLALRATGVNVGMARAQGVDDRRSLALCLALANAGAGLSGALIVQSQGFADSSTGTGTLLAGIGAVLLGELVARPGSASRVGRVALSVLAGTVLYRAILVGALRAGLEATDLDGITALILVAAVAVNRYLPTLNKILPRPRSRAAPGARSSPPVRSTASRRPEPVAEEVG